MWHLTGFSGVRESSLMEFNGTFDSTLLLTPNRNLRSCEEATQNSLTVLPNMMGMLCRAVADSSFLNRIVPRSSYRII